MQIYKSKSFTPELTNTQIETGCHTTRFIFLLKEQYNYSDKNII